MLVVVAWLGQPLLVGSGLGWAGWQPVPALLCALSLRLGLVLVGAGYAGTLWCYASMGDTWRMGVRPTERTRLVTRGLYAWVRHPIYFLQIVMLAGSAALYPSPLSFGVLLVHFVCVWTKAADEEAHLLEVHGEVYRAYQACTGRLFPRIRLGGR
jgi:protein-S-isoprenylcysteine O-methyltransferase Ste14